MLHRYEMTTPSLNVSFLYDAEGNRTGKTVTNGTSRGYYYNGTQLIKEVAGSNTIYYLYGQTGLIGFELDGVSYYYVRNLLGDVIGVIDTSGNLVVQYTYDSWGKVLSTTGSMADTVGTLNPIRYRGYYYDVETGLYYLQSRYYDPETGRFISPDVIAEGGNIYTYCLNDPVNRSDESGYLSTTWRKIFIATAIVATTVAVVAAVIATAGGAAVVATGVGLVGVTATGAVASTVATVASAVALVSATAVFADVVSDKIDSARTNNDNYTVYQLRDTATAEIVYVGRTKNPEARERAHSSRYPNAAFETVASNLSYNEARGLEQIGMLQYNTLSFKNKTGLNRINGISPKNPKIDIYMAAGAQLAHYFYNQVSNEVLNWRGV